MFTVTSLKPEIDLNNILKFGYYLAQDRDQWRALVNTAMNLRVP
jgi:hypothetical protein